MGRAGNFENVPLHLSSRVRNSGFGCTTSLLFSPRSKQGIIPGTFPENMGVVQVVREQGAVMPLGHDTIKEGRVEPPEELDMWRIEKASGPSYGTQPSQITKIKEVFSVSCNLEGSRAQQRTK